MAKVVRPSALVEPRTASREPRGYGVGVAASDLSAAAANTRPEFQ